MTQADLHVHSVFSDGLLSPEALCGLALHKRITTLALCDHDTLEGLAPMAAMVDALALQGKPLTLIPAIELSTGSGGRTHVLGYGADAESLPLQAAIAELRQKRVLRGLTMVRALDGLGIHMPQALIPQVTEGFALGRPHIARALISMGVVNTVEQAFERYLGEGKPAYVPLEHMSTVQAIAMLQKAGAVPVLAHPMRLWLESQVLEALIISLREAGLMGLEVYHPSANRGDIKTLDIMARRYNLLVTGGSDFHGDRGSRAKLGALPAGWRNWESDVAALQSAVRKAKEEKADTVLPQGRC